MSNVKTCSKYKFQEQWISAMIKVLLQKKSKFIEKQKLSFKNKLISTNDFM